MVGHQEVSGAIRNHDRAPQPTLIWRREHKGHMRPRFIELESKAGRPPPDVEKLIDAVVQREISKGRNEKLRRLANEFCNDFVRFLPRAAGEDDCVETLFKMLSPIFPDACMHTRKAGVSPCSSSITPALVCTIFYGGC